MQGRNLSNICHTVMCFFNKTAQELGKSVKFIKRKSKLTAPLFVESLLLGSLSNFAVSLEDMCLLIKKMGVKITRQGLHQRFNPEATDLMKNLFTEALQRFRAEKQPVINLLKPFSTVNIIDSTGISLPVTMKDLYQGYGGGSSEAGLKIQLLLNYKDGHMEKVALTSAREPDQKYTAYLDSVKKGGLYLQDLGYFNIDTFASIQEKEAYFISRYYPQTKLYDEKGQAIELLTELYRSGNFFSQAVWLHKKKTQTKVQVRLVASRLEEKEYEKRLRKINQAARKKGCTPTKETCELAKWSIFITNVEENILSHTEIYKVYALRWQIELFFKVCKSQAGIDKISGKNANRVQCEIYAKLISVVILMYFCFQERWQEKQEISLFKAYSQLRQRLSEFFRALTSVYLLAKFLKHFLSDLKDFSLKEKPRKKRQSTYQKLMQTTGQEILV